LYIIVYERIDHQTDRQTDRQREFMHTTFTLGSLRLTPITPQLGPHSWLHIEES